MDDGMDARSVSPGFQTPEVESVFAAYPPLLRDRLLRLRRLIFETAQATEGVGPIEETLKWGQPSYLTARSKSGTTVRIDAVKSEPGRYALYVHCQTNLVAAFREMYPDALTCEGNRGVLFDQDDPLPEDALRHCIALALTYHRRKAGKDR